MHILVMYDIPSDRIRTRVADACLDYGLERIQFSAFVGTLGRAHERELELKIARLLGREPAKVRFIPLDEHAWSHQRIIEREEPDHHDATPAALSHPSAPTDQPAP